MASRPSFWLLINTFDIALNYQIYFWTSTQLIHNGLTQLRKQSLQIHNSSIDTMHGISIHCPTEMRRIVTGFRAWISIIISLSAWPHPWHWLSGTPIVHFNQVFFYDDTAHTISYPLPNRVLRALLEAWNINAELGTSSWVMCCQTWNLALSSSRIERLRGEVNLFNESQTDVKHCVSVVYLAQMWAVYITLNTYLAAGHFD